MEPPPIQEKKLKIRTSMTKAMGPFRDSDTPSWFSGRRTDVSTEPPRIGPVCTNDGPPALGESGCS